MDYNKMHADWAMQHQNIVGKKVIVIGCNSGLDCAHFVDGGAREVHGLDVLDNIGCDYFHPKVKYTKASAEDIPIESDFFDLVYCFATMEHVPDIESAFKEMARITKPDGLIYCVASPLWNSRHGHHYPQYFADYPWAHLRLNQRQAFEYLEASNIAIEAANGDRQMVSAYMYDRTNFNMTPSHKYVSACEKLAGFKVLRNGLDIEPEAMLDEAIKIELEAKGYTSEDLRAVTHTYIGRKKSKIPAINIINGFYDIVRQLRNKLAFIKAAILRRLKA